MKRSEVLAWLQSNGGQKGDALVEYVDVPNPNYSKYTDPRQEIKAKRVTWYSNNGPTLSVIDTGEKEQVSDDSTPALVDVADGEPVYEVVGREKKEGVPRTPEKERDDQVIIAEKEKNYSAGKGWKTDAEVKKDDDDAIERNRRNTIDQQNANNASGHLQIAQSGEARAQAADIRTAAQQAHTTKNDDARLGIEQHRADLEDRRANQPTVLGTPSEDNKNIALFDPTTGTIKAQANPLYDEAKAKAKAMQEELALAIQMNKLNADQATTIYTQWFKSNVEVPFMQASEARAKAADQRAALEAEDRKRQFAAQNSISRAQLGQSAASTMVNAEIGMLPYRVGPEFGTQMSSAINGLAHGGKLDGPKADAGINFTKDAFEYDAPDLKKIAKEATKAALKGVTPYDPGNDEAPTADYTGISMPAGNIMASAPQQPNYIDTNSMYQNWVNSRYAPTP